MNNNNSNMATTYTDDLNYTFDPNLTIGISANSTGTSSSIVYTTNTNYTNYSFAPPNDALTGVVSCGDIHIKGKSLSDLLDKIDERLSDRLDKIDERLCILRVNENLEAEWQELSELGDKYRKLEQELQEKSKVWNILKK